MTLRFLENGVKVFYHHQGDGWTIQKVEAPVKNAEYPDRRSLPIGHGETRSHVTPDRLQIPERLKKVFPTEDDLLSEVRRVFGGQSW